MDFITKQKTAFWLIVILILLNVSTLVVLILNRQNQGPPMPHGKMPGDRNFFEKLNLNPEQEKAFTSYKDEYFDMIKTFNSKINKKKYELLEKLFVTEPDDKKLDNIADELGVLNAEYEKARFRHILKFKAILSEEQFQLFKNIVDRAYKPGPGMMGHGGPPPDFRNKPPGDRPPGPPDDNRDFNHDHKPPQPPDKK